MILVNPVKAATDTYSPKTYIKTSGLPYNSTHYMLNTTGWLQYNCQPGVATVTRCSAEPLVGTIAVGENLWPDLAPAGSILAQAMNTTLDSWTCAEDQFDAQVHTNVSTYAPYNQTLTISFSYSFNLILSTGVISTPGYFWNYVYGQTNLINTTIETVVEHIEYINRTIDLTKTLSDVLQWLSDNIVYVITAIVGLITAVATYINKKIADNSHVKVK